MVHVLPLPRVLTERYQQFLEHRPPGADEDIHMTPGIVNQVIHACTEPGAVILDPFAGFGTTVRLAHQAGRRAIAVELALDRADLLRKNFPTAQIIAGDARDLDRLVETPVDLVLTSPPYMTKNDHPADPLMAYTTESGDYQRYLSDLASVAHQCARLLRPGGWMVWNAANIYFRGELTPLAWDLSARLAQVLPYYGETVICWDRLPHDFTGDYLLWFRKPEAT